MEPTMNTFNEPHIKILREPDVYRTLDCVNFYSCTFNEAVETLLTNNDLIGLRSLLRSIKTMHETITGYPDLIYYSAIVFQNEVAVNDVIVPRFVKVDLVSTFPSEADNFNIETRNYDNVTYQPFEEMIPDITKVDSYSKQYGVVIKYRYWGRPEASSDNPEPLPDYFVIATYGKENADKIVSKYYKEFKCYRST